MQFDSGTQRSKMDSSLVSTQGVVPEAHNINQATGREHERIRSPRIRFNIITDHADLVEVEHIDQEAERPHAEQKKKRPQKKMQVHSKFAQAPRGRQKPTTTEDSAQRTRLTSQNNSLDKR